jgi:predicted LPLAT superfamily acyltransferase
LKRWYVHRFHTMSAHRLVFATIPRLPKFVHPPIAVVTAFLFFLLLKTERRAVVSNLTRICGGNAAGLLWKAYWAFYSFCDFLVSYCYVPRATHEQLRAMLTDQNRGADKIDACLAKGCGLVVWTAHLGNWEFASRLLEMPERRVNVARVVERDKPAETMLRDMMTNHLLQAVDLNEGAAASMKLLAALRANEIVAIQGDRVYQGFSAELPFFGVKASFPLGPFFLAYIAGAPVLPGFVVREGWLRYRVIMGDPIELPQTGDRDCDLLFGLREAVRFLEDNVRKYYDQWLNFFEFWPQGAERDV